ncbi:MAG: V-type ATPase subunit [Nitrososphaerota archaeon]|jgi:vacuolar-type H+-ATPase subunit C/Vma6|nr:V-type ATPase subunit [Nitrososphaerota archaeon]
MQTTHYASVLAKIGAQRSNLLSEAKLKTLSDSQTLPDFIAQLQETAYHTQISKIQLPLSERKLERAFNENLIETCQKIIKYAPPSVSEYLQIYLLHFEIENIKLLIKETLAGYSTEQKISKIYSSASRYVEQPTVFENAAKASNLPQLINTFKKTPYLSALNRGLNNYNKSGSAACFDVFLDVFFYDQLYVSYKKLPETEKPPANLYASIKNDSYTLLSILRGKNLNYDSNELRLTIPSNYFHLTPKEIDAMILTPTFDSALKIVLNGHYANYFSKEPSPEKTLSKAEQRFQYTVIKHAQNSPRFFFNIGLPLAYITLKETETFNLHIIALGINASMPSEIIQKQLFVR